MYVDNYSQKMKNLVEISTLVTHSLDFFNIKDKIIEKMLEVVHPAKACVNLFYKNNYEYAYLVCSDTLEEIPKLYPINNIRGVKIDFYTYPKYIQEAVKEKKVIYIKNVFQDERAIEERELAKKEGYIGRIVFPLIINDNVVGFMTCFLSSEDYLNQEDIDFVSSVASLISLSIEITLKNNNTQMLVHKLRGGIAFINEATQKLYLNKDIKGFLQHLSKQACEITNSKESLIYINKSDDNVYNFYSSKDENKTNIYPMIKSILAKEPMGAYFNNIEECKEIEIDKYIYYKLKIKDEIIGCIVCANSQNYTDDDLNIMSILAKQLSVAMQLYKYNEINIKHKVLANELNILNKQQKLIMDGSNMEWKNTKELEAYHKPARVIGGDFYHAVKINEDDIVYIVADVMGHGIVSNYVVAMIKGAFKVLVNQYENPSEIIYNLNNMLYDDFDKMGVFTTALVGKINTKNSNLIISNAGHYNPIIVNKSGEIVNNQINKKGMPIGIMREADYEDVAIDIEEYQMIFMYTDGILEVKNKNKEEYGTSRLERFIKSNYRLTKESIIENLKIELEEFAEKDQFDDDILAVMLKSK